MKTRWMAMAIALGGAAWAFDPPAAPTGLAATPGNNQVALDWNDNSPAPSGYNVWRATVAGGVYVKRNSQLLTVSQYTDTGLDNGTPYFYVVRAESGGVESANSAEVASAANGTDTTAPGPPILTSVIRKTKNPSPRTTGTAEPFTTIEVFAGTQSLGTTTAAANGTWTHQNTGISLSEGVYIFKARATDAASHVSPDSATISVTVDLTPPAAPTNVFTTAFNNCVDVEWTASTSADVAGYKIERKTASGSWTLLNSNLALGTKYRDSTASNGVAYFYRVTAVDDALEN